MGRSIGRWDNPVQTIYIVSAMLSLSRLAAMFRSIIQVHWAHSKLATSDAC